VHTLYFDSNGRPIERRSPYLKQYEDRLGPEAAGNVTTESQRRATTDDRRALVWDALRSGIGEKSRT
jgi:hypothetical protein